MTGKTIHKWTPSKLIADTLGNLGEGENALVQAEGESEIDFAVRCIETLKRRLTAQKTQVTRARNEITEMKESAKPRTLTAPDEPFDAVDLMTAIDSAEEVVLAFSDGKREVPGIAPRRVSPDLFRLTRGRVLFTSDALEVMGPGGEGSSTTLAAVALLIDGEPLALSPLAQPLAMAAGQRVNLAGSVIF